MAKNYDKIVKDCFRFKQIGSGCYKVMYKTLVRGTVYIAVVTDMTLIDRVMNEPEPTVRNLRDLRSYIKQHGHVYPNYISNDFKKF